MSAFGEHFVSPGHKLTILNAIYSVISIVLILAFVNNNQFGAQAVTIDRQGYRDLVFEIKDYVPVEKCSEFLLDLEVSSFLFHISSLFSDRKLSSL